MVGLGGAAIGALVVGGVMAYNYFWPSEKKSSEIPKEVDPPAKRALEESKDDQIGDT